jgi:hypothetical protein
MALTLTITPIFSKWETPQAQIAKARNPRTTIGAHRRQLVRTTSSASTMPEFPVKPSPTEDTYPSGPLFIDESMTDLPFSTDASPTTGPAFAYETQGGSHIIMGEARPVGPDWKGSSGSVRKSRQKKPTTTRSHLSISITNANPRSLGALPIEIYALVDQNVMPFRQVPLEKNKPPIQHKKEIVSFEGNEVERDYTRMKSPSQTKLVATADGQTGPTKILVKIGDRSAIIGVPEGYAKNIGLSFTGGHTPKVIKQSQQVPFGQRLPDMTYPLQDTKHTAYHFELDRSKALPKAPFEHLFTSK